MTTLRRRGHGADPSKAAVLSDQPTTTIRTRLYGRSRPYSRRIRQLTTGAATWLATGLLLLTGVTLALSGLAITGGSFGLLAFIGMPLLVIGLGVIGAAQTIMLTLVGREPLREASWSGRTTTAVPAPVVTTRAGLGR